MDAIFGINAINSSISSQLTFLGTEILPWETSGTSDIRNFTKPNGCKWICACILSDYVRSASSSGYVPRGIGIPVFISAALNLVYLPYLDYNGDQRNLTSYPLARFVLINPANSCYSYSQYDNEGDVKMRYFAGLYLIYFS